MLSPELGGPLGACCLCTYVAGVPLLAHVLFECHYENSSTACVVGANGLHERASAKVVPVGRTENHGHAGGHGAVLSDDDKVDGVVPDELVVRQIVPGERSIAAGCRDWEGVGCGIGVRVEECGGVGSGGTEGVRARVTRLDPRLPRY